jgi:hypothetical protein
VAQMAVAFTDGDSRQRDPDVGLILLTHVGRVHGAAGSATSPASRPSPLPRGDSNGATNVLQRVSVLQCHGCSKGVVVVEDTYWGETRHEGSGKISFRGFHWWPTPGGAPQSTDVPSSVSDAFGEASRCLSAQAPNGAVAMLRTALTWIIEDRGSATAKPKADLKDKIKTMVTEGGLPLVNAATAVWSNMGCPGSARAG